MIVGRLIGMMLTVLAGVSATGCAITNATTSMPGAAAAQPARPTPMLVDPSQIFNDPLQGP